MSFLDSVRGIFRKQPRDDQAPYSIVLLFRSPFSLSKEGLEAAAAKAYGVQYDGSHAMYFVFWDAAFKTVKAGESLISVLEVEEPYLGDPVEVSKGFNDKRLATAWSEHRTWAAFDLMNDDMPKKQAYRVLAALVVGLLDDRCAGIYVPKENQFTIQSDGSAEKHLRHLCR